MSELRWPTYPSRGVTLSHAHGVDGRGTAHVQDDQGKIYLDAIGGIGCACLGHADPRWVSAISGQLAKISASANSFGTAPQIALAARLCELFPIDDARVFFANTGSEAHRSRRQGGAACNGP